MGTGIIGTRESGSGFPQALACDAEYGLGLDFEPPEADWLFAAKATAVLVGRNTSQRRLDALKTLLRGAAVRLRHALLLQRIHAREAPDRLIQIDGKASLGRGLEKRTQLVAQTLEIDAEPLRLSVLEFFQRNERKRISRESRPDRRLPRDELG